MHGTAIATRSAVPPATEIDCIETNKVFDKCLVRDCLAAPTIFGVDIDPTCITDITCSDFTIDVAAPIIPTRRSTDEPGFVRISFPFTINYNLNISSRLTCAPLIVPGEPIEANVSNILLYSPEPLAYILTQQGTGDAPTPLENTTIKLEFIGECIEVDFAPSVPTVAPDATDITPIIGYYLVIKSEQVVQIMVLSRGYCTAPKCTDPVMDPRGDFEQRPIPAFFPAQRAPF